MGKQERLLVLALAIPYARCFSCGTSAAHPPCGGPPMTSVRSPSLQPAMVLDLSKTPASSAASVATVAHQLQEGMKLALEDRRRIDELVTNFEYNGAVSVPGEGIRYEGQGAVKRFLTALLLDNEVHSVEHGADADAVVVSLDDSSGTHRELTLHVASDGAMVAGTTLITSLRVQETTLASHPELAEDMLFTPLFGGAGATAFSLAGEDEGPKWETYDGRVRQRIWQHDDLFASGNRVLKDTMELTTGRLIMMVDRTVWDLYGEKMRTWADSVDLELDTIVADANEDKKTLATFTYMLDELKRADPLRRSEPILCVGGGVLTDTAGFACACWRRGIPWVRMPTTLLGIVDASVGIKVAINYHRKNGVGHFFSPSHTFIDRSFLGTVSLPDIRSGVGEIMKAALIHDARLYELMEAHGERLIASRFQESEEAARVIKYSIDAMLECIGPDLWEEALLRPMDYGHSFSRTLEADERFYLRHGEAVAIDALFSALIAEVKGLFPHEQADALLALYAKLGLPCSIAGITAATYKKARDEIVVHRDGLLRAPLPAGIGECRYVDEITDEEIDQAFARLEAFMANHPQTIWDISKSFAAGYDDVHEEAA